MRAQTPRQILVMTGVTLCCFSEGFIFGQMSGMIDGLRSTESDVKLSDEDVSWIASIINIVCFGGFFILTVVNEILGRRKAVIVVTSPLILSWILVYFAETKTTLLISRVIAGITLGGLGLIVYVCIGEYVSPKNRPLCLNMTSSVGINAGTIVGHILSTVMHWRHVALVGIIPSTLAAVLPLFWVESPSWLASKERFDESENAFKQLHKPSEASNKELQLLILNNKNKVYRNSSQNSSSLRLLAKNTLAASKTVYFWKLCLLLLIIVTYRVVAGRVFFSTFTITIIQDIAGSSSLTYSTLFVDGFWLVGTILSCVLVSKYNLRHIILILGTVANVIQVLLVASLYIWQDRYDYVVWIKISLLALYFVIVNAGPYGVIETLLSEIFPLDLKGVLLPVAGIACGVLQFLCIKFTPSIGNNGMLLINSLLVFVCLIYLYYFLPETKGRTLQEIESYFKYNTFDIQTVESHNENKELQNLNVT